MLHCPPPGLNRLQPLSSCSTCLATAAALQQLALQVRGRTLQHSADVQMQYTDSPDCSGHCSVVCDDAKLGQFPQSSARWVETHGCANECDCFFAAPGSAIKRRLHAFPSWRQWLHASLSEFCFPAWEGQGSTPVNQGLGAAPSHLAMFEDLYEVPQVRRHLDKLGYSVRASFFHQLRVHRSAHGWLPHFQPYHLLLLAI